MARKHFKLSTHKRGLAASQRIRVTLLSFSPVTSGSLRAAARLNVCSWLIFFRLGFFFRSTTDEPAARQFPIFVGEPSGGSFSRYERNRSLAGAPRVSVGAKCAAILSLTRDFSVDRLLDTSSVGCRNSPSEKITMNTKYII